jgi:hypothetical protein
MADDANCTYPRNQPSTIVPVYGTFARVPHSSDVALSTQKNRVYQRLRFVESVQQEHSCRDETEKDGQVICSQIVGSIFGGHSDGGLG